MASELAFSFLLILMWLYRHYSVIRPSFVVFVIVVGDGGDVYGGTRLINLNVGRLKEKVFYTGMTTSIESLFLVL
jgi:hypothetical protein